MEKVVLVTGANRGIGYGLVRLMSQQHPDWSVYGTCRNVSDGENAAEKLREEGLAVTFLQADVTDADSFSAVRDRLANDHGGIDILVNNAGILVPSSYTHTERVKKTMEVNAFGTHMVCDTMIPILKKDSRIVILASFLGLRGLKSIQDTNPARYSEYVRDNPPLTTQEVLSSLQDYVSSVSDGTFVERGWPDDSAFRMSKMAGSLLARSLQQDLDNQQPDKQIIVNAVDPGHCKTNMSSYKGDYTIDEGAATVHDVIVQSEDTLVRGAHISRGKVLPWNALSAT